MRCLLINPFYPLSENPSPPLGLAYLGAALEKEGAVVKILDFVVFPYSPDRFRNEMEDFKPDMVGATSVTMTFNNAISIIRDVKRINQNCLTLMGGPHISFCAEETLRNFPELDIAVIGEGDETIIEILTELGNGGKNWKSISGIVYRKAESIVSTGNRPNFADINALSTPARHLLSLGRYRALGMPISMTTSRGCPYKCIFCVGRKMVGHKIRYRDPEKVVDEMESLQKYGFIQINIADDLFTANPGHCLAVCKEILERDIKVKWTSFSRVDTVSPDMLKSMKEAGCQAISFGIESGNPQILKTIRKGITLEQVIDAVSLCNEVGLLAHGSFILGLPGETPETLRQTLAFGEKLKAMGVSYGFHLLAPFPGTMVREKSKSLGLSILSGNWSDYHANRAIVETSSVSRKMLDDIVINWENDFNKYLGLLAERISSGEASADEAWPLVNLERTVLFYNLMMENALESLDGGQVLFSREKEYLLNDLVNRLGFKTGVGREKLLNGMSHAFENGFIKYSFIEERVKWEWA